MVCNSQCPIFWQLLQNLKDILVRGYWLELLFGVTKAHIPLGIYFVFVLAINPTQVKSLCNVNCSTFIMYEFFFIEMR